MLTVPLINKVILNQVYWNGSSDFSLLKLGPSNYFHHQKQINLTE